MERLWFNSLAFLLLVKRRLGCLQVYQLHVYVVEITLWVVVNLRRSFKVSLVMSLFPVMVLSG